MIFAIAVTIASEVVIEGVMTGMAYIINGIRSLSIILILLNVAQ
jgi:hypothetical protein